MAELYLAPVPAALRSESLIGPSEGQRPEPTPPPFKVDGPAHLHRAGALQGPAPFTPGRAYPAPCRAPPGPVSQSSYSRPGQGARHDHGPLAAAGERARRGQDRTQPGPGITGVSPQRLARVAPHHRAPASRKLPHRAASASTTRRPRPPSAPSPRSASRGSPGPPPSQTTSRAHSARRQYPAST